MLAGLFTLIRRVHRGGGGSPLPMNPLEVSSFVSKSAACALTACEHVFVIDPDRVSSHARFTQLSTCKHLIDDRRRARKIE